MNSTSRATARPGVRTRSTGVISLRSVRIGLTFSAEPSQACAAPMRPPRRRNSSVSTANQIRVALARLRGPRGDGVASPPERAAAAAASDDHRQPAAGASPSRSPPRARRGRPRASCVLRLERGLARCPRSRPRCGPRRRRRPASRSGRRPRGSRRSRAARSSAAGRGAQLLVVGAEVGHVGLALLASVPVDVETDQVDVVRGDELARQVVRRVRDDRDRRHGVAPYNSGAVSKTLVTGATGFIGSHVARALLDRGDEVRVLGPPSSQAENLAGPRPRRRQGRHQRPALDLAGAARRRPRLPRGRADLAAGERREAPRRSTSRGRATCSTRACRPAWSAWSTPRRSRRSARRRGADRRRAPALHAARGGIPYVNAKHEAEVEAQRFGAPGLPVVDRQPGPRLRPRRRQPLLDRPRAPLPAARGSRPTSTARINVVDVGDVAAGHLLADESGKRRRALHPRQPQLHARPPLRRPRPDLRHRAARAEAALPGRARLAQAAERAARPAARHDDRGPRARRQWWTFRNTKAKRELGCQALAARGDHRRHGRVVPRARVRPLLARAARPAVPAEDRGLGDQPRRGPRGPDGSLK